MTKSISDKDMYDRICDYLYGVKCLYGSKQIPMTLSRHPKIRDFLKTYLTDNAKDIEIDLSL